MGVSLKTGKMAFKIDFDNGDSGVVYFNPNDPNIFLRFAEFDKRVGEKLKDLVDVELKADGSPANMDMLGSIDSITKIICGEIDFAFGGEVSEVAFRHCSPFAIVDGEYFLHQFVKAMRVEIERINKQATAEARKSLVNKHSARNKAR